MLPLINDQQETPPLVILDILQQQTVDTCVLKMTLLAKPRIC